MRLTILPLVFLLSDGRAEVGEWSGNVAVEGRLFFEDALEGRQHGSNLSLSAQPEYYIEWDNRQQSFLFAPFVRFDQGDPERSHGDIRELTWMKVAETWELRLGVRRVFWGVTESQHLVDIINQTDLVENPDGEDKLGQPMVNFAWIQDWGTVDLFWMPYFRERTFPGPEGRLRGGPPVDTDKAQYADDVGQWNKDWAVRYSHTTGDWDFGVYHFSGVSRDPDFLPVLDGRGDAILIPRYVGIDQTGLDAQATKGDTLWKLEAIYRNGQGNYFALTGGFEHTLYGLAESEKDLGLLIEYLWDERGDDAPVLFEDDLFLGARLTLNDADSTEVLVGVIQDLDTSARLFNIEASTRLWESWKLSLEGRYFGNFDPPRPQNGLRNDSYLQTEMAWFF